MTSTTQPTRTAPLEPETGTPMEPTTPSVTPIRDRRTEEPRGRWEDRCLFSWNIAADRTLICDRPTEHKGLHRGRIVEVNYGKSAVVLGYGARG